MTQRLRPALVLLVSSLVLAGTAAAAPAPVAPKTVREVVTVERTAKHGLAALALIGKVKADRVPGFFAEADRSKGGARLNAILDFNGATGLTRYGHGGEEPLCGQPLVCSLDLTTNTLTFTLTTTDDADDRGGDWAGITRYFALEGSSIELTWAAVGFKVSRHTSASFARVSRDQADEDGVGLYGQGAEVFRSAQLAGGAKGSFAVVQLPCEDAGAGAATFSATGDTLPSLLDCTPNGTPGVYVAGNGSGAYWGGEAGLYSRSAGGPTQWQVSGAVSGISSTTTRLFVLSY